MLLDWSKVKENWKPFFESQEKELLSIDSYLVERQRDGAQICPNLNLVFRAFESVDVDQFKCLNIAQDPYPHNAACGLAFSIAPGEKTAQSLKNIHKELKRDLGIDNYHSDGDLSKWSSQILMLNAALTTEFGKADAHKKIWKSFSVNLIEYINLHSPYFVFLAWGKSAHKLSESVDERHDVIKTSHPSPLGCTKSGVGFVSFNGSSCFSMVNTLLDSKGYTLINWKL